MDNTAASAGLLTVFILIVVVVAGVAVTRTESFGNVCPEFNPSGSQLYRSPAGQPGYTTSSFSMYPLTPREKADSLYSPIIVRPREHQGQTFNYPCSNELYPRAPSPFGKGEQSSPCNPEIEAKYYAMRPLLNTDQYHDMLGKLFRHIEQKVPFPTASIRFPEEFCDKDCFHGVIRFIMDRINRAKTDLPVFKAYAKNDTWGGEQFAYLNEKVYAFTAQDTNRMSEQERARAARYGAVPGPRKFVVTFTLHNTLRSSSTDVVATVFSKNNKYYLRSINFATKGPSDWVQAYTFQPSKGGIEPQPGNNSDTNKPSWLFGNTIQNKLFNLKGFYDEPNNILIEGGVPKELNAFVDKHDQKIYMPPANRLNSVAKGSRAGYFEPNKYTTYVNSPVRPDWPNLNPEWNVAV